MLNFQKIYEWFFNSFRMNGGTHLIRIFEQEHVKHLMIIRRSWIYGILINLLFIPIVAATVVNISFILMDFASNPVIGSLSIGIIAFGALLLIYSGSVHIFRFHKVRGGTNDILDIYE